MTFLYCLIMTVCGQVEPAPVIVDAFASRYDEGVMSATVSARVAWNHLLIDDVIAVDGFVAVGDCSRIGERVTLRDASRPDQPWLEMLVADCAGDEHAAAFMRELAVEVDHKTAQSWGFDCLCAWPIEIKTNAPADDN